MSGNSYLLDTCFILGLCNQHKTVLQKFGHLNISNCYFSLVNRIELLGYHSITHKDEMFIGSVLSAMTCLPLSLRVEQETIALRKKHKIKLPDAVILATTHIHNLQLLTLDKKLQQFTQLSQ